MLRAAGKATWGNGPRRALVHEQSVELHRRFYEAFNARDAHRDDALSDLGVSAESLDPIVP
jgi:hypothetical protein